MALHWRNVWRNRKDLIVIDKSETVINDAVAFTDNAYLMADLSKENLRNVGIQNCDTVIIGIGGNLAVSILTSMIVLQLVCPMSLPRR